jgi:hypothetical protein
VKELDTRSPDWLGSDEPLPREVLEAIRAADREDGSAAQVARLEARLRPLLQGAGRGPAVSGGERSSLPVSAGKLLTAGLALVGAAALVRPQREQAQRSLPELASARNAPIAAPASAPSPAPTLAPEETPAPAADVRSTSPSIPIEGREAGKPTATATAPNAHDSLALEARLLSRARRALESEPAEALKLTERHRRQFPRGVLSEEREVIAIKALLRTGHASAAAARQLRFRQRFPASPHANQMELAPSQSGS